MFSRRNFIITGICSAVSSSVIASGANNTDVWLNAPDHQDHSQGLKNLSYKSLEMHKGNSLQLHNDEMTIKIKIADVHNMNSDNRLEQFSLLLEPTDKSIDLSGIYNAQLAGESSGADFPISIIGNQSGSNEGKYFAVFSRIKTV